MSLHNVQDKGEVFVKEEPMYDGVLTDTCLVREPGLYTAQNVYSDHKVKLGLPEPDLIQGLESAKTAQDTYCITESDDDGVSAAQVELYAGHIVKEELVLGPELLHPLDTTTQLKSLNPSQVTTSKQEPNVDLELTCSEYEDPALQNKANNENESYICGICSKRFIDNDACVEHLLKHTSVKSYACKICDEKFSRKYELYSHENMHLNRKPPEQPNSCDICNQEFWQPSLLSNHKRTHVVEKPYQCDICKTKFATKCGLNKHKKKHFKSSYKPRDNTVKKPYTCEICNNKLTIKYNLDKHKLIHLADKLFYCSICGRGFANKGNLIRHKKKHMNM
ncbi:zinc finger protein 287-like [Cydia pomonella]|uniref:zinc finger protein 287-like n=1 Tax=Cydia pomonella TaxID=82600 RepID=UPI002ADE532D|nr:zinc finger protein 287-like [Cydia pomonella]